MGRTTINKLVHVVEAQSRHFMTETSKINKRMSSMQRGAKQLGGAIAGAFAAQQIAGDIFQRVKKFDQSIADLSAITGATGKQLDFLSDSAKDLGRVTTLSASQVADGFKLIASQKPELLENSEALKSVTKEAIALAEAAGINMVDASTALTTVLNQFNLSAEESARVINVLAAGSKFGAGSIEFLNGSIQKFGTVAASLKIPVEQAAAAAEVLAQKGFTAEEAGIKLRNVLLTLAQDSSNYKDGVFNLSAALNSLAPDVDDVTKMTGLFKRQNVTAAQSLVTLRDRMGELQEKMTGTSVAYEQQETRTDTLAGSIEKLDSAWEGLVLSGEGLAGVLQKIVEGLTKLVELAGSDGFSKLMKMQAMFALPAGSTIALMDKMIAFWEKADKVNKSYGNTGRDTGFLGSIFDPQPTTTTTTTTTGGGSSGPAKINLGEALNPDGVALVASHMGDITYQAQSLIDMIPELTSEQGKYTEGQIAALGEMNEKQQAAIVSLMAFGNIINSVFSQGINDAAGFARALSAVVLQLLAMAQAQLIFKEISKGGLFGLASAGIGLGILSGILSKAKSEREEAVIRNGDLQFASGSITNSRNVSSR